MVHDAIQRWRCTEQTRNIALDRFVRFQIGELSWQRARRLILSGKLSINGTTVRISTARVKVGDWIEFNPGAREQSATLHQSVPVLFVDSQIVVVNKPAGISTVPFDKNERGTLIDLVRQSIESPGSIRPPTLHVVHRIDKPTSGVVVFARTRASLLRLKQLFRVHDIERRYLALVRGYLGERTFHSRLVANRGDGKRGSTSNMRLGLDAITHVRAVEHFKSATLVQCRLETGRTHQIRIQLAEAGFPLLGERVYAKAAEPVRLARRLMLHAAYLAFSHPLTGLPLEYSSEIPNDMAETIERLRRAGPGRQR